MMRVLLFGVGVAMVMLAVSRQRPLLVRFLRPFPPDLIERSRVKKELKMDQALASPRITRTGVSSLGARIAAIAGKWEAERTLALRAADKAALHRRNLAELRAMYVRPVDE